MTAALMLAALAVLPPYPTPAHAARQAVIEVAGSPSGALVEVRLPGEDHWLVAGVLPCFVAVPHSEKGLYTVRASCGGYGTRAVVTELRSGTTARVELHLALDARSPRFEGTWLAYVRDGGVHAVEMRWPLSQSDERTLLPAADASAVVWMPDGRLVIQSKARGTLTVLDLDMDSTDALEQPPTAFELRWPMPRSNAVLGTVARSLPDESYGTREVLQPVIVDLDTGEQRPLGLAENDLGDATVSPDGRWFVASAPGKAFDGALALFDLHGRLVREIPADDSAPGLRERAFMPDGRRLLTTRWDPARGARTELLDLEGRVLWEGRRGLYDLRPAPDGIHYAASRISEDGPEIVVGMLGSLEVIPVARGTRPAWSPPPRPAER